MWHHVHPWNFASSLDYVDLTLISNSPCSTWTEALILSCWLEDETGKWHPPQPKCSIRRCSRIDTCVTGSWMHTPSTRVLKLSRTDDDDYYRVKLRMGWAHDGRAMWIWFPDWCTYKLFNWLESMGLINSVKVPVSRHNCDLVAQHTLTEVSEFGFLLRIMSYQNKDHEHLLVHQNHLIEHGTAYNLIYSYNMIMSNVELCTICALLNRFRGSM